MGGAPVGTMSSSNNNTYRDVVIPAALPQAGIADTARDVLEFDTKWTLTTPTSCRPVIREIDSVGGSRFVEVLSTAANTLTDGLILPFIAPVYIVGSPDATFSFDRGGWPYPGASYSSKKSYAVALFGEQSFYDDGPTKLISAAYEIHNVSSALNKQGTITIGDPGMRTASTYANFYASNDTAAGTVNVANSASLNVDHLIGVPRNASELIACAGARQWAAEYGCYAIYPPTNEPNDFEDPSSRIKILTPTPFSDPSCPTKLPVNTIPASSGTFVPVGIASMQHAYVASAVNVGIRPMCASSESLSPVYTFVDGINSESVFTITVRLTYETIPFPTSPLISLARMPHCPSLEFPLVMCQVFNELAPYCMVAENAKGTWFKKVMSVARKAIPIWKAARGLAPPQLQLVGDTAVKILEDSKPKKKQASKPNTPKPRPQSAKPANPRAPTSEPTYVTGKGGRQVPVMIKLKN